MLADAERSIKDSGKQQRVSVPRLAFVVGLKFGYIIVSQGVNSKGCDNMVNLQCAEASQPDLQPMHDSARTSNIVGVHPTAQGPLATLEKSDVIGYVRLSAASPVTMCGASDNDVRMEDTASKTVRALHTCARLWVRLGRLCVFAFIKEMSKLREEL